MIPFGPWRPDVGGPNKPFAAKAEGVVPQSAAEGVGYGPFPRLVGVPDVFKLYRATTATYYDEDGIIQTAAIDELRVKREPPDFEEDGVLVEDAATNLLTYSEQLDNAEWTKLRISVTANAVASPDGATTADKLVEDMDTNTHVLARSVSPAGNTIYTWSEWFKSDERTVVRMETSSGFAGSVNAADFDLVAGTSETVFGSPTVSMMEFPDGWWRCSLAVASQASPVGAFLYTRLKSGGDTSYTGDGASGLYAWGYQLEVGGSPTSYIPTEASTVTRAADNYTTSTMSLSDAPRGIASLQKSSGVWDVYAATATTIEKLGSDYHWTEIDSGRTVPAGDDVSFLHYGSFLLNTDTTSGFKAYNVDTPGTNDAVSGAPAARFIFSCSNVIFALDCDGNKRRMESSARGSHTNWTTQGADGKTFEDGGPLIAGCDLKNGMALIGQDQAMRLVTFGQGPALYRIDKVADGRGIVSARTLVSFDGAAFWWDKDGPWQFTVGGGLVPIGAEKINRWAEANISSANYGNLQGTVDPSRNLVIWRVDDLYGLAYNWLIKEWSTIPMVTAALSRLATAGITIDDLTGTIDELDATINNRDWSGGAPLLGALDSTYRYASFIGPNMAGTLETSVLSQQREELVSWVRPVSDAPTSSVTVGTSPSLATDLTWAQQRQRKDHGWTEQRSRGRNLSFRETIPAGETWTYTNGVEIGGGPQ